MKRGILILVFAFCVSQNIFSQCPQGAIGVTGAGCGCLSGCDLTSFGGPNCSPSVAGDCSAGYVPMQVDIIVPAGCTFTVTAVMQNRPGCTASGADGNCVTCDRLKVDIPGGPKPFQIGGGNSSLSDSYTLAGPATIRVSGAANRADEIITYSTTFSGAFCDACGSILPIELITFKATATDEIVELTWTTESEINSDYFAVESSSDGVQFEPIGYMDAAGNSSSRMSYKLYDSSPFKNNITYYRLKQIDLNGDYTYSEIISVVIKETIAAYYDGAIHFNFFGFAENPKRIEIYNLLGQLIYTLNTAHEFEELEWQDPGMFIVVLPELGVTEKLLIP